MNPLVLLIPLAVFMFCLLIHVLVWRLYRPARKHIALLGIFAILPCAAWAACLFLVSLGAAESLPGLSFSEWLACLLLMLSFSGAYIMTYPAFEALSPTLVMVLAIGDEKEGLACGRLSSFLGSETLFEPRLKDLLASGLVRMDGGMLALTAKGALLAGFFVAFRAFLGLPRGEG